MSGQNEPPPQRLADVKNEDVSLVREFLQFLGHNKKYWLLPIVIVLLLLGVLIILGGSPAAPFIYTLF